MGVDVRGPEGSFSRRVGAGFVGALFVLAAVWAGAGPASAAPPISEFPLPTADSGPIGIANGPDGNVWFTAFNANTVGKMTPTGVVTQYAVPTARSNVDQIVAGPDGNLWFTEAAGNKVGKVTTGGAFTEYPIPTAASDPE